MANQLLGGIIIGASLVCLFLYIRNSIEDSRKRRERVKAFELTLTKTQFEVYVDLFTQRYV